MYYPLFLAQKYRELNEICLAVDSIERAEYTYKKSEALLANQSYLTKVQAENALLGAKLSRLLGKTETHVEFLTKARSIYQELGDIRSSKNLESQLTFETIEEERKEQPYFLIRINRASGQNIEVTTGLTDRAPQPRKLYIFENSILREIIDILLQRKPRPLIDVRFESEFTEVNALPWEAFSLTRKGLMPFSIAPAIRFFCRSLTRESRYPNWKIRWLQLVLNEIMSSRLVFDGIWGPSTRDALVRFQEKLRELMNEEYPIVLIIQASSEYEKVTYRGIQDRGINLELLYRRYYEGDVSSLKENSVDELRYFLRKFRPKIIHMVGTIKEPLKSGELFIDFGESKYKKRKFVDPGSEFFSAKIISRLLKELPGDFPPPLLIIESVSSPGETE